MWPGGGPVPVHATELDSSEKVLMSSGLAEDRGDWEPPASDSPAFLWKGEARDTDDITAAGDNTGLRLTLAHDAHTHSVPAAV